MSSTVTSATVATVTAAITIEGLGQALVLVAVVLFGLALLAKEITATSNSALGRTLSRGIDMGVAPLGTVFALIIVLNMIAFVVSRG